MAAATTTADVIWLAWMLGLQGKTWWEEVLKTWRRRNKSISTKFIEAMIGVCSLWRLGTYDDQMFMNISNVGVMLARSEACIWAQTSCARGGPCFGPAHCCSVLKSGKATAKVQRPHLASLPLRAKGHANKRTRPLWVSKRNAGMWRWNPTRAVWTRVQLPPAWAVYA